MYNFHEDSLNLFFIVMEHQKQQMIIQELKKELKTADDRILDYASALRCSEQSLVELLNKHKYVIDSARKDMDIGRIFFYV